MADFMAKSVNRYLLMVTSRAKIQRGPVMAERNFANRTLYHGDNLDFLRGMNSSTVNLIATDPPFNKSRDFHATPDSLSSGAQFQDRWSWQDDIHGVVTPSGPATTGWWECSRRMRKRSIGRSHRTRCRQHPLIRRADWSTRRKGIPGCGTVGLFQRVRSGNAGHAHMQRTGGASAADAAQHRLPD